MVRKEGSEKEQGMTYPYFKIPDGANVTIRFLPDNNLRPLPKYEPLNECILCDMGVPKSVRIKVKSINGVPVEDTSLHVSAGMNKQLSEFLNTKRKKKSRK